MDQKIKLDFEIICDRGIIFAFCALILFLPISIALVDSFAALAIFCYILKKVNRICLGWTLKDRGRTLYHRIILFIKGFSPVSSILNRPIEILTIVIFISVCQSQYFGLSLFAFVGKFSKGICLFFSFIEVFTKERRIWLFVIVFIASAFLISVSGLTQSFIGVDFLRGQSLSGGRISSSFRFANSLGAYLIPILALLSQILYKSAGKEKSTGLQLVLIVSFVLAMVCLGWTYSRASWVGFLFSFVFMTLIDRRQILYNLALIVLFVFLFEPSLNHVRHVSLFKDTVISQSSLKGEYFQFSHGGSGRFEFWKNAIFIIQTHPIWGSGLNTYTRMLKHFSFPLWYAHNCYLQNAAETGLVGLTSFLWMLFVFFNKGLVSFKKSQGWSKALLQGAMAGLAGFLVECFFDNALYTVQLGILFWVVLGLAVALMNLNLRRETFDGNELSKG